MLRARIVDVSELEPPEPMAVALASLRELGVDEYLVLRHRREPIPLFPMLIEMGFACRVRDGRATPIEVVIWRSDAPEPVVEH